MSANLTDQPSVMDAAITVLAAVFLGLLLWVIWLAAAGRFAEPGRITIPTTTPPVIATIEETP